jgi:folate-binding protein YgfZ
VNLQNQYAAVKSRGGVINLSHRVKLAFTGADRIRYLNGQITARLTGKPGIIPACVTSAKGKLCADIFVSTWEQLVVVDADPAVAATLPARMEKYIVADDVEMTEAPEKALLHCVGITPAQIADLAPALPSTRFGIPGCDLALVDTHELPALWEALTSRFAIVTDELAECLRVEAGIPRWGFELDDNTLPAEAGLDRTHIDFHKGCYIGQEVISRVKSVGHVNRSLRGFVTQNRETIDAKSRIFSVDYLDKEIGFITSVANSQALNRPIALGYLRRGMPESGLMAVSPEAPDAPVRLELSNLPFTHERA